MSHPLKRNNWGSAWGEGRGKGKDGLAGGGTEAAQENQCVRLGANVT